ncbi:MULTISPECIES: PseG/SpsG family protein [Micromonospora]|uniref:Spore coat protein n=1 Tax=Micromonospora solifontis TaxID=2487138 RepID=A0ABX9WJX3_9ACTN|nr:MULTISPECIES: spore coat protein [Micromonospora]NES15539.1 spore coat protein [Micromonospora sp. PPF5-17B]NES36891.1 spore coat protein [Micromonospora solifontis]NES55234.1 spore coat protein [Micromonospora sp. PPF5-6]RNL98941.1 spore coat protein [Micromonospora solifontis]
MTGLRVGLRCDAGPRRGVGHLVRCVALGEEFLARGAHVALLGSVAGVEWAAGQLAARGIPHHPGPDTPDGLVAAAREHALDVLVLDSYELDPACAGALRAAGIRTLAIVDGDARGQDADLYLDQNLDARTVAPADRLLAGTRYALLRREVLSRRPAAPRPPTPAARPRVLAFFGGTDAFGAAPPLTRLLLGTGQPMELTVVVAREPTAAELAAVRPARGQTLRLVPPTDTLPGMIAEADLVVSAAGTSTWELCCLGAPSALVCVVDNQRDSYHRVIREGVAAGLGELPTLIAAGPDGRAARADAVQALRGLLTSADRRAALSARAWSTVDGRGRVRVVDAVLALLATPTPH